MGAFEPLPATACLVIDPGSPLIEVEILNGHLQPLTLQANLGQVEMAVAPGAYMVRFRIGDNVVQKHVLITGENERAVVSLKENEMPVFASAVPVANTRTMHETQLLRAEQQSRIQALQPIADHAGGSQLLVFARDHDMGIAPYDPSVGLTIHDIGGGLRADLAVTGNRNIEERWAACHLELEPGPYRLRLNRGRSGILEQIVWTAPDWQTQVFLRGQDDSVEERVARRVYLAGMSVLMAREGRGFVGGSREDVLTEQALAALRTGTGVAGGRINDMLWGKYRDPMLGIYGAYLHFGREKINTELMVTVFGNLLNLVGPIPDVLGIGWSLLLKVPAFTGRKELLAKLQELGPVDAPPMLLEAWFNVVKGTAIDSDLIPERSISAQVGDRILSGRPWVKWRGVLSKPDQSKWALEGLPTSTAKKMAAEVMDEPIARQRGSRKGLLRRLGEQITKHFGPAAIDFILPRVAKLLGGDKNLPYALATGHFSALERDLAYAAYPLAQPSFLKLHREDPELAEKLVKPMNERLLDIPALIEELLVPTGTAVRSTWILWWKLQTCRLVPMQVARDRFIDQESQGNALLRQLLESLEEQHTRFSLSKNSGAINARDFLIMRYRTPLALPEVDIPTGQELALLLKKQGFKFGRRQTAPTARQVGVTLSEIRALVVGQLREHIDTNPRIHLFAGQDWQTKVLPRPNRFQRGSLFPEAIEPE